MQAGSITFSTALDNEQLEKDLQSLTKKIEKKEKDIADLTAKRDEAKEKGLFDMGTLDAEKAKLQEIKDQLTDLRNMSKDKAYSPETREDYAAQIPALKQEYEDQQTRVNALQREWNKVESSVDRYTAQITEAETELARQKEEAGGIALKIKEAEDRASELWMEIKKAKSEVESLEKDGKWFGDKEYDAAYRKLTLLIEQIKEYKKQLEKTPEQLKKEQASTQRELNKAMETAKKETAALEESIRLNKIANEAEIADQSIVSLVKRLEELKKRQKDLELAGAGLGYKEYEKNAAEISKITGDLKAHRAEIEQIAKSADKMQSATERANERMARFGKRLKEILLSAFIFNVISRALTSLQQLTMKYIKTNDEARRAIAQMKGALLTLAQPLIEVVIPAFTLFVNILTKIITVVAQLVSSLFGKTIKQSQDGAKALHKEANAIGAVGEAAEEASGSLAGFDEINTISTENAKGAGGAGASSGDEIAPDFSWMDSVDSGFLDRLKEIADLVGLIGAGFALWKIGSMLPGVLGQIAKLLGGILLTVGGLLTFWNGLTDAWENGVDWLNLIEMIGGLAATAFGLYTIFELLHPGWGKIAAGIALVVGGIAMLVTGFHDAMENGWNLQNTLLSIAGILATGLGIALITGSWIPLLVAGIASVLLALTIATGHGEELLDGIKEVMKGLLDFFTGVFTGDWELAAQGLVEIFNGVDASVTAVLEGVRDAFGGFLDWLDEKTGGRFHDIIEILRETVSGVIDGVEEILDGFTDFLTGIFTGDIETAIGDRKSVV